MLKESKMGERGSKMGEPESKMGRFIKHKSKSKIGRKKSKSYIAIAPSAPMVPMPMLMPWRDSVGRICLAYLEHSN